MHATSAVLVLIALLDTAFAAGRSAYTLGPAIGYPTETRPAAARVADVTGDGALDVVVAAAGGDGNANEVLVFPQLADGTLGEPVGFPFGGNAIVRALAAGDVDGDGATDVVVSAWLGGTYLFFGTGFGRLDGPYTVDERESYDILAADLDADGDDDLVTVSGEGVHAFARVDGARFDERLVGTPAATWELAHADVTGDGARDVVGAGSSWTWMLVVYAGNADGSFAEEVVWTDGRASLAGALAAADFDGDGATDVVVAGSGNSPVRLYVFPSGGGEPAGLESYDLPTSVDAGDLDGDGDADLVVGHDGWGAVTVHLQEEGGLTGPTRYATPTHGELSQDAVAIGDVTGDDCADVVVADAVHGVLVLPGLGCGETLPDEEPDDTGALEDTGAPDDTGADTADTAPTDPASDTGEPDTGAPPLVDDGCGCAADARAPAWLVLPLLLAARRRSRR